MKTNTTRNLRKNFSASTLLIASSFVVTAWAGPDDLFQSKQTSAAERAENVRDAESAVNRARTVSAPKNPAAKTITSFTQALRCMDELFLANGKQGIVITSAGIPDATGKARAGDKEMMISAISKMTLKSNAFEFIDLTAGQSGEGDLMKLFELKGGGATKIPDYYIRGAVTQLDDNTVRDSKGMGIALPFLDFSTSKDKSYDLISMDMSIGDAATRRILPETNTSNTMVITKSGRSGEAGGKIEKMGLSFNKDLSRSEGVGATYRTLIELGLVEALGKFTRVPYWKCLDIDSANPDLMDQVREWYDVATTQERITFVQQKLASMGRYKGPQDGKMSDGFKNSIAEYQAAAGLIADGRMNFDLYFSLKDDTQNQLVALPVTPVRPAAPPRQNVPLAAPAAPAAPAVDAAPGAASASAPIVMNLVSDRGGAPSYKVGELLSLKMSLNKQGFAYCFYQDVGGTTARIFPNRFHRDSMLAGNLVIPMPTGGFKIKFDKAGRERVGCVSSDRELVLPSALANANDLSPVPVNSLDQALGQIRAANPIMNTNIVEITVQ
jgi:peptidoglycan hydrolase-like protein with peptidoglycan-binding domain